MPPLPLPVDPQAVYSSVKLGSEYSDAIRLIALGLDQSGKLKCTLKVTGLSEYVEYFALSYCWQDASSSHDTSGRDREPVFVNCQGCPFPLHDNLYNALSRLHQKFPQRLFWIDAISIDQSNNAEKVAQVQLMATIYSRAAEVLVWLGEEIVDTPHIRQAAELMGAITKTLKDAPETEWRGILPSSDDSVQHNNVEPLVLHERELWISLVQFFRRNWFTRAWVVQEVVLAKHDPIVLCGEWDLSWDHIQAVSDFLSRRNLWKTKFEAVLFPDSGKDLSAYGGARKIQATKEAVDRMSRYAEHDTTAYARPDHDAMSIFLESLIRTREFSCSDPRDKVFSCCGVGGRGLSPDTPFLVPDYTISVAEAYIRATRLLLKDSRNLHVLAHAEGQNFRRQQGLPSWVPDWSVTEKMGLGITGHRRYDASQGLSQNLHFADTDAIQGGMLYLEAARIGQITYLGDRKSDIANGKGLTNSLLLVAHSDSPYLTGESLMEAFWRTLIANTNSHKPHCPADAGLESGFQEWLKARSTTRQLEALTDMGDSCTSYPSSVEEQHDPRCPLRSSYQKRKPSQDPSSSSPQNAVSFDQCSINRLRLTFFRTNQGLFGLGSESLQEGDTVWIVPGSRVPLIMRQLPACSKARYELVGGTYVHGIMHGEVLDGVPCKSSTAFPAGLRPLKLSRIEVE